MSGTAPPIPPPSPVVLNPSAQRRFRVRRVNRGPLIIGGVVFFGLSAALAWAMYTRMQTAQNVSVAEETPPRSATPPSGFLSAATDAGLPTQSNRRSGPAKSDPQPNDPPQLAANATIEDPRVRAWTEYYQRMAQIQAARDDLAMKAMAGDTGVDTKGSHPGAGFLGAGDPNGTIPPPYPGQPSPLPYPGSQGGRQGLPSAGVDAGAQAEKRAFLASGQIPTNEDLQAVLHGPKPHTIMEGTSINLTAVRGMDTDMPGTFMAQVDAPVCDSQTGDDLLIPQWSRIIGHYDNSISNGQTRVGLLLDRVIFPDTSSLQLGGMEGADAQGYAGVRDQVDKHWTEKFLSATIIAIGGAAVQLAQPQQSAFSGISPGSTATGALTQQYAQLGQESARAGMSIPNTLRIRPGNAFTMAVGKDIALPSRGICGE